MLLGRFEHNLDDKGRVAIPSRFRSELGEGLVLTRGIDRCVVGYPQSTWRIMTEAIDRMPMTDPDARQFRRLVYSSAIDLVPDGQGRVVLPPDLRNHAGIERAVIVVGVSSSIELWSPTQWHEIEAQLEASGDQIAARLASMLLHERSTMPNFNHGFARF